MASLKKRVSKKITKIKRVVGKKASKVKKNAKRRATKVKRKAKQTKKAIRKTVSKITKSTLHRIKQHWSFLQRLYAVSHDIVATKNILKKASKGEILALAEIFFNLLRQNPNLVLSVNQKRILCPLRSKIREFVSKKTNCDRKRELCTNQRGGILGIIGTVLSVAIPALVRLFSGS